MKKRNPVQEARRLRRKALRAAAPNPGRPVVIDAPAPRCPNCGSAEFENDKSLLAPDEFEPRPQYANCTRCALRVFIAWF